LMDFPFFPLLPQARPAKPRDHAQASGTSSFNSLFPCSMPRKKYWMDNRSPTPSFLLRLFFFFSPGRDRCHPGMKSSSWLTFPLSLFPDLFFPLAIRKRERMVSSLLLLRFFPCRTMWRKRGKMLKHVDHPPFF